MALIPQPQVSAAVAVAATIWLMARFNCIHPSGGAIALFIVLDGPYAVERIGPTLGLVALNGVAILVADFLRQIDATTTAGVAVRLQGLLKRTPGPNSEKAEVVGQLMSSEVYAAKPDTQISEILRQITGKSIRHVPIVDEKRRVLGIVTQSDLLEALYQRLALSVTHH